MNRPLTLLLAVLVILGAGFLVFRATRPSAPPPAALPADMAGPLEPPPPYVETAREFFTFWQAAQYPQLYQLLTDNLRSLITESELTTQMSEARPSRFEVLASTAAGDAAFVILSVQVPPGGGSAVPIAGYSLLLRKAGKDWRVALFVAEEKVTEKYGNLTIKPATETEGAGFIVTFTDEQGQISTLNLQEP
jgi:hypothetical protein